MTALLCLAAALYFEARSEPVDAQAAVAAVVLERVESPRWPDTVCEVVFQPRQFSAFNRGVPALQEPVGWEASILVAAAILADPEGTVPIRGATHYHAVSVQPYWARHYRFLGRHGDHLFYAAPRGL